MDQNSKSIVLIRNQAPIAYLNFNAIFDFLGQFTKKIHFISQKGDDIFEIEHKTW